MKNYRLDAYLHDKGYVTSRERSKQLILGKFVYVDDKLITKPSYPVKDGVKIEITGNLYISRGYLKIEKAVRAFNISPENKTAVDIGAIFTDMVT
jgi:23S rRNA (cytidine1920-2'-O)/16S rRNA (cytidine1409-2'-O)-methyltransferase